MGTIRQINGVKKVRFEGRIQLKGVPLLTARFDTKTEAKNWITTEESKILNGHTVSPTKVGKKTIEEIINNFIQTHKRINEEGEIEYLTGLNEKKEYSLGFLVHHLGDLTLQTLTHEKIQLFFETLSKTQIPPPKKRTKIHKLYEGETVKFYKPATVRKYYFDLKVVLEDYAFKTNFKLENRFVKQPSYENWTPRELRINEDEEKKLIEACSAMYKAPEQWKQIIKLALATAMRTSEVLKLKHGSVFLEDNKKYLVVQKDTTKMKEVRSVPLSNSAIEVLKENIAFKLKKQEKINPEERVFNLLPITTFSASFKKITHRAGVKIVFSDTRHEGLCRLFEKTQLSVIEICLMSGHESVDTLKDYVRKLRPAFIADKLN